ncbi:MAG: amino acid ABC transporter permease [Pseudomonadota bacterium]
MIPAREPPASARFAGLKRTYFGSLASTFTTIALAIVILWIAFEAFDWAVLSAVWQVSEDVSICREAAGACWAVIGERGRLILFGLYPQEEHWRSALACILLIVVAVLTCLPRFWSARMIAGLWAIGFLGFYFLMRGGVLGLTPIPERDWGGLALTLFIFASVIVIGMPLAVCLALLRQSRLHVISGTIGLIIDGVRALPLLSILFAAAVLLPLALPQWLETNQLYRVICGFSLFFAAYQAEIIRGGMAVIPNGQDEAGQALGLSYAQRMGLIILPQAFRNALPPTINQVVVAFKETSLVIIVGFFEVLASGNAAYGTGRWTFAYVEVYVFIGLIYFSFVFSLSRYGAYLERRGAGAVHHR